MDFEELKSQMQEAFEKAKEDRDRFFDWIKDQIEEAIGLINSFDKIYVVGGLGLRLLKSNPNFYNVFLEEHKKLGQEVPEDELIEEDDHIETILEYAINISSATSNENTGTIPTQDDIDKIYERLLTIKTNIGFYEMAADIPQGGNEFDHILRTNIMTESMNVRGVGYGIHIREIFLELFTPHNQKLIDTYGFSFEQLFDVIQKLDVLVTSKMGNAFGGAQSHKRLIEWMEEKGEKNVDKELMETGRPFIQQFVEENPDLYSSQNPLNVILYSLDSIQNSNKIFWIIPRGEVEERIFDLLSHEFGDNSQFFEPEKFKAFPLGDSQIFEKPLLKVSDNYYCFSLLLVFRNLFSIASSLLNAADPDYYESQFTGNAARNSKDNYVERKAKEIFEELLPNAQFYSNLTYQVTEGGVIKDTELDILGLSDNAAYIIEVKSGELHKKHRRGALKGLKDRLEQTIDAGSYQCKRAENFISENDNPTFGYAADGTSNPVNIDKERIKKIYKITVTFEQLGFISSNLKALVYNGVLKADYKWSWIISIYDLMVFGDILKGEDQFQEYLDHRLELYEREDVQFFDEIDLLGYFLENGFPIPVQEQGSILSIHGNSRNLDQYYTKESLGYPVNPKPSKLEKSRNRKPESQPSKVKNEKKKRSLRKASKKSKKANRKRKKK